MAYARGKTPESDVDSGGSDDGSLSDFCDGARDNFEKSGNEQRFSLQWELVS